MGGGDILATARGNLQELAIGRRREGTFKTPHSRRAELSYFEGLVAIETDRVDVQASANEIPTEVDMSVVSV